MPSIHITRFGGVRPAVSERALPSTYAQVAHNAKLQDGTLKPFAAPAKVKDTEFEPCTIWTPPEIECCPDIMCWPGCVWPTTPPDPGCQGFSWAAIYAQGADPIRMNICTGEAAPLCVPAPLDPLSASVVNEGDVNDYTGPDERVYTYTWVDQFGVESAPAPAAYAGAVNDNGYVELSGFGAPPVHICEVRLYRTTSAMNVDQGDVSFQLVETLSPQTVKTVDGARLKDLEYGTLLTEHRCCPPDGLQCVFDTELGYQVGFVGNQLMFSERHDPSNWPDVNRFTLPTKIRGLAVYGDIVYVGTAGAPYRAFLGVGQDPVFQTPALAVDIKPFGMLAPLTRSGNIVATPDGAFIASPKGLFALSGDRIANVSRSRIEDCDWPDFYPHRIEWANGRLFASKWPSKGGWIMDMRVGDNGAVDIGDLVTVDYAPKASSHGVSSRLLFSGADGVYEWGAGPEKLPYRWRSKCFVSAGLLAFNAAKVVADYGPPVGFKLVQDGRVVVDKLVESGEPFTLPICGRGLKFEIELTGTTRVHEVHVATSRPELTEAT